jgi:hypothetical protein
MPLISWPGRGEHRPKLASAGRDPSPCRASPPVRRFERTFARANSKSQWWLRQSGGDTVAEPHRVDGPGAICGRDPYVGPNDAPVPKIWYFLLDNQPRPWHERGGGGSSSDSTRVLASVLGGGSERVPGGGDRWRGTSRRRSRRFGDAQRVSGRSFSFRFLLRNALLDRTDLVHKELA